MSTTSEEANKTSGVHVVEAVELHDLPSPNGEESSERESENWEPGFRKRFPWMGIGCLLTAILITVAEIIILVKSDGKSVSQWTLKGKSVAPNVILSILNSCAGVCFAIAVAQGIAISWWRKAMRGATIKDLHNTWSFGSSISAIVLNLKYFNLAALAAVVTKLTIVDGVLFQRSTTTYIALGLPHDHIVTTFPTKHMPLTARLNSFGNDTDYLPYEYTYNIQNWLSSAYGSVYSVYGYSDCEGICGVNSPNPGYVATCDWTEQPVDFIADLSFGNVTNSTEAKETDLLSIDFTLNFATPEKNYTWIGVDMVNYVPLDLNTTNSTQRCPATLYRTQCELKQSIINYPVYMQFSNQSTTSRHGAISKVDVYLGGLNKTEGTWAQPQDFDYELGQLPGFDWISDVVTSNKTPGPFSYTTNGGIYQALKDRYTSRAYLTTHANDTGHWSVSFDRPYAALLANNEDPPENNNTCPFRYDDPMQSIMPGLNTLTFIVSDDLYNRANWTDNAFTEDEANAYWDDSIVMASATQYITEVHYSTNYHFMFGALASTLLCAYLVLPVYWGFWELGKKVSLNPIEIANAFQAPMLSAEKVPRSGHADDVIKVTRKRQVVYGQYGDEENGPVRRFIAPS
ncbi:hypothetical protein BKA65DRAFT_595279 [Rhexocercosporidium sp. MPI-PUGE-AT-0058]|nr:hypothetical protein BKA65DRAFT_595279 [Rhexocercosporidium sp. MPI-PUGE-AT-0058]